VRRAAIDSGTPLITDIKTAIFTAMSLHRKWTREKAGRPFWSYNAWQEYTKARESSDFNESVGVNAQVTQY